MKIIKSISIILVFVLHAFAQESTSSLQNDPHNPPFRENTILLKFKDDISFNKSLLKGNSIATGISTIDQLNQTYRVESMVSVFKNTKSKSNKTFFLDAIGEKRDIPSLDKIYKIKYQARISPKQLAEQYAQDPNIEYAEPDYYFFKSDTHPNDPLYTNGDQWHFAAVNAPAAWDLSTGSNSQIIGIINTGVDWNHPDLNDNIWSNTQEIANNGIDDDGNGYIDDVRGWDFVNDDNDPNDDNSHGTHVAGIAAAETNNNVGGAGVAWNAQIMPVKMLQSSGTGTSSDLAAAINYAAQNGATVINMSLGSYAESQTVKAALENAYVTAVLVAAAGNDGYKVDPPYPPFPVYAPAYPACYSFVIGVEATTQSNTLAAFSNRDLSGPVVAANDFNHNYEIRAPGVDIWSTFPSSDYHKLNGTSMASPIVAGAVALIKDHNPNMSTEALFARLIQSANNGILDIYEAMTRQLTTDLHYVGFTLLDTLAGDDGDGIPDAGETIQIFVTVKNAGGDADSVWSQIRLGQFEDPGTATIDNANSLLGDLSPYATLTGEDFPFVLTIDSDVSNNRNIVLEVEIFSRQQSFGTEEIIITVQNGFEISGLISQNTIWDASKEYLVTGNLRVETGVTLQLDPGARVLLIEGATIDCWGSLIALGTPENPIFIGSNSVENRGKGFSFRSGNTFQFDYCHFDNLNSLFENLGARIEVTNSQITNCGDEFLNGFVFKGGDFHVTQSNLFHNVFARNISDLRNNCEFRNNNFSFNSVGHLSSLGFLNFTSDDFVFDKNNSINNDAPVVWINFTHQPSHDMSGNYWGSSDLDAIHAAIYDFGEDAQLPGAVVEPFLTAPSDSAHGVVWKVEINGLNPQESAVDPIGSETVKFDVFFNTAMDTSVTPFLSFGVRAPFTQHVMQDNASWSADSTVWTAYFTSGLETGDGLQTIRVANARDAENFKIPTESTRFQFIIQAAAAASTQFIANADIGKVDLEWPVANSSDVLGYNMYRFEALTDTTFNDTLLINNVLITDSVYTDFNILPDVTYFYMYKVLGSDFTESDFSKTVTATPVNAAGGDANGDLAVNVLDITSIVNWILNQNPQPFLFDAADINDDGQINVLDIVGVVNAIIGSSTSGYTAAFSSTPAELGLDNQSAQMKNAGSISALQLKISGSQLNRDNFVPGELLQNMEYAYFIESDEMTLVLYNLNNAALKDAGTLFSFTNGTLEEVVEIVAADATGELIQIGRNGAEDAIPEKYSLSQNYPNPFNPTTTIRYGLPEQQDVEITVFNLLGQLVKTFRFQNQTAGYHELKWNGKNDMNREIASGIYVYRLKSGSAIITKKMLLIR